MSGVNTVERDSSAESPSVDFTALRQQLMRAVARICPSWLADRRDDLVQAAVMRVMQVLEKRSTAGEGNEPLKASYLHRVAHSALVDEIRRVRRRRETDLESETGPELGVTKEDPERYARSREIGQGVQDCLARMKQERRLAVTLYLQGHSVPEAASILGWSAKRTENLVYRGLKDLRECLLSKGLRP